MFYSIPTKFFTKENFFLIVEIAGDKRWLQLSSLQIESLKLRNFYFKIQFYRFLMLFLML